MTDMTDNSAIATVEVNFTSKTGIEVPENYFTVPLTVGRYGLSEIVNKLTNTEPPRPFDFLVEGRFLRTDLGAYLKTRTEQAERGLTLEVVEALAAPDTDKGTPHPDWVASVGIFKNNDLVTGCYDGVVRVYGAEGGTLNVHNTSLSGAGHTGAVKGVAVVDGVPGVFASCSKDRTVRLWGYNLEEGKVGTRAIIEGHTESVEAIAVNGTKLVSAGWDRSIQLWDVKAVLGGEGDGGEEGEEEERDAKKSKKSKTNASAPHTVKLAERVFEGHTQAVSALTWPHPVALYSGSWDYSIRQWDMSTGQNANTWQGNKAITSLSFSPDANLLASGHEDKHVRVWDPRLQEAEVIKMTLKSHKKWVTGVAFSPTNPHLLASCSHDQTVKLWDMRSTIPLHTLRTHTDKALCLSWNRQGQLVSGGADCQLMLHKLK